MTNSMGRVIFESRYRNPNRYSKNAGMMSEHEDIDSDFVHPHESDCIDSDFIHPHESDCIDSDFVHPSSERSIVSSETGDDIEPYYSSDSSLKHQEITHVYDRTNSSDDDSVEISLSDTDDEDKNDGSNTSPTSSMSFSGREESIKVDNSKKIEEIAIKKENKGFFGKFFSSLKSNSKGVEVPTKRISDLSDADVESALTSDKGYSSTESEFSVYEDSNHSQSQSNSRSLSTDCASESETSAVSPMVVSPRRSLQKERISTLPDVEEGAEGEEESVEEYRTYKRPMAKDPDQQVFEKEPPVEIEVSESEPESSSIPEIPPEQTPDPISPLLQISKEAPNTKSFKKKKKKKKQKNKAHASALSPRNHAVSNRIDWAGQINSAAKPSKKRTKAKSTKQSNKQLEAEVHRLRTLVELMMTRMTLYERQSECFLETGLEQDQEWKIATIEHYEEAAKKRTTQSEVDKRLNHITNLVAERDIRDEWIRELECVQRGYEERLETTQNQLKELRLQHALTTKQIRDLKKNGREKNGGELTISTHTPDTLTEDYNFLSEAKTPVMSNGLAPIKRWLAPTNSGTTLSGTFTGTMTGTLSESDRMDPSSTDVSSFSAQSIDSPGTPVPKTSPGPGIKEYTSLLEDMIVAWNPDSGEISDMSEHGVKRKPKKEKKKKKKKR